MIKGFTLAKAIISGTNNIQNNKQLVDELNVFPVPDGDTGTNMSMTINATRQEITKYMKDEKVPATKVADVVASALLRGARGNSGVILSLLFRGISKGLKDKEEFNGKDFADALSLGVDAAYKAVMQPTEGTILTVARVAAEKAVEFSNENDNINDVFDIIIEVAKDTLDKTPDLLPVLKKAGVVDAGGMGLVVIFEGMQSVFNNDQVIELKDAVTETMDNKAPVLNAVADYDGEITFGYCTEFIVNKHQNSKDPMKLRAYLETIGDSVVCVDDEDIIKVHVHTNDPGLAIQNGLNFGQLSNMKIDNMRIQHEAKVVESNYVNQGDDYVVAEQENEYGFVAVGAGDGIKSLFVDLGVDHVVTGGQTMNPSTQDILKAIMSTPAKTVFVLPNNKNIIMAAEQTIKLADRRVCVLQTRTVPQGISAMLAFEPDGSYDENRIAMTKQFDSVRTGLVTFAARDSDFDGHTIKKGEILGLDNGKLAFVEKDITKTVLRLVKQLIKKKGDASFVTLYYGSDVTEEQAEALLTSVENKFGNNNISVNLINGTQPVYYYMISVE